MSNDFPTHYETLPLKQSCMYQTVLGKFAVVYTHTHFVNIFKFLNSRNSKCASFGLLRNLITHLYLKFLSKLQKNYKNITFHG